MQDCVKMHLDVLTRLRNRFVSVLGLLVHFRDQTDKKWFTVYCNITIWHFSLCYGVAVKRLYKI